MELRGAHPRSRGENLIPLTNPSISDGSSPLTRGKHLRLALTALISGLIPAHAGKTNHPQDVGSPDAAHPRSRGENHLVNVVRMDEYGSSPLTRGKRPHVRRLVGEERLIPAHAGKTSCSCTSSLCRWAHPRSRGENMGKLFFQLCATGSSPLTRGKRRVHRQAAPLRRLIPAHAGKTT